MTTPTVAFAERRTLLDRIAHWALDPDGDIYGDERERLRWYEGTAVAATLQWIAVPWAAAVLIWPLGRPAVLPLAVVLAVLYLPMLVCSTYVSRRRVETVPRSWSAKRLVLTVLGGLPYVVFILGAAAAWTPASFARGMRQGAIGGVVLAVAVLAVQTCLRNRREGNAPVEDED